MGFDPVFDSVIAHPGWITHIKDFVAQERTVFTNGGGVALRWPGQASGVHGGGEERHVGHKSGNHTWHDPIEYDEEGHYVSGYEDGGAGQFDGQLVSVLLALNDSPIGGGNTALVPGSEFVSSIYQDRLGTKIAKVEGKGGFYRANGKNRWDGVSGGQMFSTNTSTLHTWYLLRPILV